MEYHFNTKLKCNILSGLIWKDYEQPRALPAVWTAWFREVKGGCGFCLFRFSLISALVWFIWWLVFWVFLFFTVFIARFPFGMFSALCGWWVSTAQCTAAHCCFVCVKASDGKMVSCVSGPPACARVSSGWMESRASPTPVHPAATRTTGWTGLWDSRGPANTVKGGGERGWGGIPLSVGCRDCGP